MLRKTRPASRFFFSFIAIVLVVIALALLVANAKKWYDRYKQEKEITALRNDIARLKEEEANQARFLEQLKSPFFIEREGREKLNAKKPGETVVLFPKFEDGEHGNTGTAGGAESTFFRAWAKYFFHLP